MRRLVDGIVVVIMFIALYINLTDFPKPSRVVTGTLIKME